MATRGVWDKVPLVAAAVPAVVGTTLTAMVPRRLAELHGADPSASAAGVPGEEGFDHEPGHGGEASGVF